ncbi:MAG: class I SAM-dependent methyltransferase [Geminicoccaceae bacterium]
MSSDPDWKVYYEVTDGRPPRPTMLKALDLFVGEGRRSGLEALDLGCGTGRDALPLLRAGWRVHALDQEEAALEGLREKAAAAGLSDLHTIHAAYEEASLPPVDLVNASFTLFASAPDRFPGLWDKIVNAVRPGGRFAGQLLGVKDSWAARPHMSVHTADELARLLSKLEVEWLNEEEDDAVTPRGEAKHWHIYHVVARKPS